MLREFSAVVLSMPIKVVILNLNLPSNTGRTLNIPHEN